MFPSTHDILPEFLEQSAQVIEQLLAAGNKVLIVTKPHLECVKRLCTLPPDHLLFRFTIGAFDDDTLKFWEPSGRRFTTNGWQA